MQRRHVFSGILGVLMWMTIVMPSAVARDVPAPLYKMRTIIGHAVIDQDGKEVGHVEEVVLEATTGAVAYAVLARGGVVGLGEQLYAIPWHVVQPPTNTDTFRLAIPAAQLQDAPGFDKDRWPDLEDRHWGDAIHVYYGQLPALGKRLPPQKDEGGKPVPQRLLRASNVLRGKAVNTRGQRMGEIEEVVMDASTGTVAYVALAFGGVMGLGEKLFAIPWQAVQQSPGLGTFTVHMDKETLEAAPGFDKDHWPTTAMPITR